MGKANGSTCAAQTSGSDWLPALYPALNDRHALKRGKYRLKLLSSLTIHKIAKSRPKQFKVMSSNVLIYKSKTKMYSV